MKNMFKDFFSNIKRYIDYLMKVDFKELFVNTIILICIILLASLVYLPIGIIQDLIRSIIVIYARFTGNSSLLFEWFFNLLSAICAFVAFVYMFNKRFEDIDALKKQINNKSNKITDNKKKIDVKKDQEEKKEIEEIELPKTKDKK